MHHCASQWGCRNASRKSRRSLKSLFASLGENHVVLAEVGITGAALDAVRACQPGLHQFQDGVLHRSRTNEIQWMQQDSSAESTGRSGGASKGSVVAKRSSPF
jgi:hypothetical protein